MTNLGTYGFPVRFQKVALASSSDEAGCSPAICARSVAFRALKRFLNRLARRTWVALIKYARCRSSPTAPLRSNSFLNRLKAKPIDSLSARTIRIPIYRRLVRLTRCRWKASLAAEQPRSPTARRLVKRLKPSIRPPHHSGHSRTPTQPIKDEFCPAPASESMARAATRLAGWTPIVVDGDFSYVRLNPMTESITFKDEISPHFP
jgi:hypothetical protein